MSVLAFGLALCSARGQSPALPAIPVPAPPADQPAPDRPTPAVPDNLPGLGTPQPFVAPPVMSPAPGPTAPFPPPPVTAPPPPPGLVVGPPGGSPFVPPPPGQCGPSILDGIFFFGVDAAFVKPHVSNGLHAIVPRLDGTFAAVGPPAAPLDWTVSPTLLLGYKLPENQGEFRLGYRFEATEGTATAATPAGVVGVKSRLDENIVDLEYGSVRFPFALTDPQNSVPLWDVKWFLGVRFDSTFYDTVAATPLQVDKASNYFIGAGPRGGFEIEREFNLLLRFYLFARGNASVLVGQVNQKFSETFPPAPASLLAAGLERNNTQSVPEVDLQIGMRFVVPEAEYIQFSLGYQVERWWSLGRDSMLGTRLNLTDQGFFLRGEIQF
jgi:hypothetical protein